MRTVVDENKAKEAVINGVPKATETLQDEQKAKKLIEKLEAKLKNTKLTEMLETIPVFISCLKSYVKGEYKEIPLGTMAAIVSALIYWVSPLDIIPDVIPGIGHIDDAAVVLACLAMVKSDLDDYKNWLEQNKEKPQQEGE